MMASLSARERRLVAILITLALIAIVWLGIVSPLTDGFTRREEARALLRQQFARNERQIATIAPLRRSIELQRLDAVDYRTTGKTAADGIESLKERLSELLTKEGGELRAVQDVSERPGWGTVWAEARMTLPQLVSSLTKVQNQTPYLAVTGLTVSADRALQSGKLDSMDVRIEVSSPIAAPQSR